MLRPVAVCTGPQYCKDDRRTISVLVTGKPIQEDTEGVELEGRLGSRLGLGRRKVLTEADSPPNQETQHRSPQFCAHSNLGTDPSRPIEANIVNMG